MRHIHTPWRHAGLSLAVCAAAALSACGGDQRVSAMAVADSATVDRGASVTIDVLGNDKGSGALKLAQVGQPANGSARIDGDKVVYTPAAGYYGADTFAYTVNSSEGASATAHVSVAVQAPLALEGRAYDEALENAEITVTIGDQTFTTTADASGFYKLLVKALSPLDFIVLEAKGKGKQEHVKLKSLGGGADQMVQAHDAAASDPNAAPPAFNATNVTTAVYALATAANGGEVPATQAALDQATAAISPDAIVQTAAVIKLVADMGVPMPEGITDTAALVTAGATFDSFLQAQMSENLAQFKEATQAVVSDPALAVAPVKEVKTPLTQVFYIGKGCCALGAVELTRKPDGTATVLDSTGQHAATWKVEDGDVVVSHNQPIDWGLRYWLDADGVEHEGNLIETGFRMRQLVGNNDAGAATLRSTGYYTDAANSAVKFPLSIADSMPVNYSLVKPSSLRSPTVAELTSAPVFGILDPTNYSGADHANQDVARFNADGTGKLERTGKAFKWQRSDAELTLDFGDVIQRITRASQTSDGEQRWITRAQSVSAEGVVQEKALYEVMVAAQQDSLGGFSTQNALGNWLSYVNAGVLPGQRVHMNITSDGNSLLTWSESDGVEHSYPPEWWTIGSDLELVMTRNWDGNLGVWSPACAPDNSACSMHYLRTWRKIRQTGNTMLVYERLYYPDRYGPNMPLDHWRVNRYTLEPKAAPAAAAQRVKTSAARSASAAAKPNRVDADHLAGLFGVRY